MKFVRYQCAQCQEWAEQPTSAVNRARRIGAPLYCNRICSGLGRRKHKSKEQKVAEKAAYDRVYREKNITRLKANKRAYHQATYDPVSAAAYRKKRMPQHVEYCRRPEYRAYKQQYDRQYRAREFGEFGDAYLLAVDLNRLVKSRSTNYEIRQENGTNNKTLRRKRAAIVSAGS